MNNTEEVTNTFFVHSFIAVSALILIFGTFCAINLIRILGDIISTGNTADSPIVIAIGVACVVIMPYCFRIIKSLQILEILESNKLLLHPPIFVNDMNHPNEIELSQITDISRDNIFGNLITITFVENGDERKIHSFIKKGKLNVIKKSVTNKTV